MTNKNAKSFICQNWLDCDMNYAEFESYGLLEVTEDQAKELLSHCEKMFILPFLNTPNTVIEVVLSSDRFVRPKFYRDLDFSDLGVKNIDLDRFSVLSAVKAAKIRDTYCADEVENQVIHVSKDGVVWSGHLADDEVRVMTAQLSFKHLEKLAGDTPAGAEKKRSKQSKRG